MANVYITKFKAEAEFGTAKTLYPVQSLSLTYPLDGVASATLNIAVGTSVKPGAVNIDNIEAILGLPIFTKVQIFITAEEIGKPESADPLPSGRTLIFSGYIATPAARLGNSPTSGTAAASVQLAGEIAVLETVPRMISTLTAAVGMNSGAAVNQAIERQASVLSHTGVGACKAKATEFIRGQIETIVGLMTLCMDGSDAFQAREVSKPYAEAAIQRIRYAPESKISFDSRIANISADARAAFSTSIAKYFATVWFSGMTSDPEVMNNGSVLEPFGQFRNDFYWHVIPTINFDYCAPLSLGIGGPAWRVITPDDYFECSGVTDFKGSNMLGFVDSVVLYDAATVGKDLFDYSAWKARVGAAKLATGSAKQGGKVFLQVAPAWLNLTTSDGETSLGALRPGFGITDALQPNPESTEEEVQYNAALTSFAKSGLQDAVAKTILMEKAFDTRKMNITGRVRFDIAPGSLLQVQVPGDRNSQSISSLFGHVESVTINIDGGSDGSGSASTSFTLTSLRTELDHSTLTTPTHPLYGQAFNGIGLL